MRANGPAVKRPNGMGDGVWWWWWWWWTASSSGAARIEDRVDSIRCGAVESRGWCAATAAGLLFGAPRRHSHIRSNAAWNSSRRRCRDGDRAGGASRRSGRTGGSEGRPASQSKQLKSCGRVGSLLANPAASPSPSPPLGWQAKPGAADNCSPARNEGRKEVKQGKKYRLCTKGTAQRNCRLGRLVSSRLWSSTRQGVWQGKKRCRLEPVVQALESGWPRLLALVLLDLGGGQDDNTGHDSRAPL